MKSIYDEAIEILLNMGAEFISVPCNPIGEENSDMIHLRDATETYEANMHEVVKALKQAQKQEKLLELYRELDDCIVAPTGHHVCRYTDDEKYARIRKQIKELEGDMTDEKMNEILKNELLIFQAAQLLQEIRIDRRDVKQVKQKVVAAFELLHQAGYEFDEEYIQEYIKHCQIDGRHARNAALNYNDMLNSLSQPKEYYEKLLRSKENE